MLLEGVDRSGRSFVAARVEFALKQMKTRQGSLDVSSAARAKFEGAWDVVRTRNSAKQFRSMLWQARLAYETAGSEAKLEFLRTLWKEVKDREEN
jgi:hypothetical protein